MISEFVWGILEEETVSGCTYTPEYSHQDQTRLRTSSVSAGMLRTFLSLLGLHISSSTWALTVSPQEHAEGHWAGRGEF